MSNLQTSWHCEEAVTAISDHNDWLFAGTVSGEIHSYNLQTYQVGPYSQCHSAAVLVLIVRNGFLISGSGDSLVKVWRINEKNGNLILLNTSYCVTDVGEIFCVEMIGDTVYLGTQNASIHWFKLPGSLASPSPPACHRSLHPAIRPNRFFDSIGPGGRMAPQQHHTKRLHSIVHEDATLNEVSLESVINFAHNGYVYAMAATQIDNNDILVTGSSDGTVKAWSLHNGLEELWSINVEESVLGMCLFNSWQLYCSLESGHVVIIDLETQQMMKRYIPPGRPLLTLSIINSTAYIAGGNTIYRYDPITKNLLQWDDTDEITATIALGKKPNLLVTTSRDGNISIWNVGDTQLTSSSKTEGGKNHQYQQNSSLSSLADHLDDDSMIEVLSHIISYRSVSRDDRFYWHECRNCAASIRDILRQLGATAELLKVEEGNPIVYAHFKAQKRANRTPARILFYGHYDVIDADSKHWSTPPFELVSGDGYLYGRGTSDNKGPVVASIYAVAQLFKNGELNNDVTFLIEGEEERGSFGFKKTIESHIDKIGRKFDWIVFSNSYWIDDKSPCLNYGLRGVVFFDLEVTNDKNDVHSGVDGGTLREPSQDMVNLLASLSNANTNEIMIPGFKENVLPVSGQEQEHYDDIIKSNPSLSKEDLIRRWTAPTLTIHSIDFSSPSNASVIPGTVTARISFRIVPNQTTEEITTKTSEFVEHSFGLLESPNKLGVKCVYGAEPWLGDISNEPYSIMKEALMQEWGTDPLFIREGGSIPVARTLETLFDAPAAQLPCGQSSDAAHLKNERLRVTNLITARKVFKRLFDGVRPRSSE